VAGVYARTLKMLPLALTRNPSPSRHIVAYTALFQHEWNQTAVEEFPI
jgi:hypothetical protein